MEFETLFSEVYEMSDELLKSSKDIMLKVGGYSMFPCLRPGDLIKIRHFSIDTLQIGDIIVFRAKKNWIAHRIRKIDYSGNKRIFITKGDSCPNNDIPIFEENVVGKVVSYHRKNKEKELFIKKLRNGKRLANNDYPMMKIFIRIWLKYILTKFRIKNQIMRFSKNVAFLTQTSKGSFRLNIIISTLMGILPLLVIYEIKWLIDMIAKIKQASGSAQNYSQILIIICLIALTFLIQSVLSIIIGITREKLLQSVSKYVFKVLQEKHTILEMEYLESNIHQDKIHKAIQEAGIRPNKIINQYLNLWQSLASWVVIAVLLFSIHWLIFFLILLAVIPGFLVRIQYSKDLYGYNSGIVKKDREAYYYNRILTGLPFAKEIRLFGLREFFMTMFESIQNDIHTSKSELIKRHFVKELNSHIFGVFVLFLSFGFVVYSSLNGIITVGTVALFFLIFQRGYSVMRDILMSVSSLLEDNAFLQDFIDFLNLPVIRNIKNEEKTFDFLQKGISFKNVWFRYPGSQRNALNSISIEIPQGKTVAFVGANGSGKTTLIKLLCGFYTPQKGRIMFDDLDMSLLNLDSYRKKVTAVFQDFALYNLTAIDNIRMGDINRVLSENSVKEAAKMAGIDDVLEQLPLSYHTMLGNLFEKGEDLSIGQWQKLAIAKAFYRNTPLLLLDEPSSSLDAETESLLLQKLKLLANEKTVVIVSHRFTTIKWADIIYVIEEGYIAESGNHEHLMNLRGKYFEMFSAGTLK